MSKNKGFYKTLFYMNITKSLYACLLLLIFRLFKVMRLTRYVILPLNLKKVFIPLDRNLEDFEEALKYAYFSSMYEILPEFKPKRDYTVVDVGSHYGFYTLKVASKVREVISLEPNPRCYYVLVHNLLINKLSNVKAIPVAAGSKKARAFIKTFSSDEISKVTFKEEGASTLIVPLDELLQMLGISSIDIMKIDVEGYEVEVLKGLMTYIKNGKVKKIVAEIHSKHLLREVLNILSPHFHHMRIFNVSDDVFIIFISS
ncbi:MAG: FkbM family methyltransferase [Thermofilaceae archaeon]